MADVIRVENLVKRFGDFTAVNGINISVKEGEIFGLLGPNGAGKTTTINMLLTLLTPTSGKIIVAGMDLAKEHAKAKRLMGLMTQETVVEADLTARENLDIFARLYHIPPAKAKKKIEEALEEADLVKFADAKSGTLSGGMQRRLGLVKAMLQEPKILVLDEPTTGLDVQNRSSMWARIKQLNSNGTTIILTTQYLEEADQLCDRLAIIDHGKVIALGTPSEIKRIVGKGRILEIITGQNETQKVAMLLKSKFGLAPEIKGDRVTAVLENGKEADFTKISANIDKEKLTVISIGMHLPTLDDVFIKLTGAGLRDSSGDMKGGRGSLGVHR
jgi:ABC-2 type transport system ATP-binding protein